MNNLTEALDMKMHIKTIKNFRSPRIIFSFRQKSNLEVMKLYFGIDNFREISPLLVNNGGKFKNKKTKCKIPQRISGKLSI